MSLPEALEDLKKTREGNLSPMGSSIWEPLRAEVHEQGVGRSPVGVEALGPIPDAQGRWCPEGFMPSLDGAAGGAGVRLSMCHEPAQVCT